MLTKRGDEWDPNFEYLELTGARLEKVLISTTQTSAGGTSGESSDLMTKRDQLLKKPGHPTRMSHA